MNTPKTKTEAMNRILVEIQTPECPVHPRYQAKRRPRLSCEACWRKYIYLHPDPSAEFDYEDLP